MKKTKKKTVSEPTSNGLFSVIKIKEDDGSWLFDCIPDVWFTNEWKDTCLWPPLKGKKVAIRAVKLDIPDESFKMYKCEVVKGGFVTYNSGTAHVREKCAQKYNTSSAEENIEAARFRRKHPGLSLENLESFENVFSTKTSNPQKKGSASTEHTSKDYNPEQATVSDVNVPENTAVVSNHSKQPKHRCRSRSCQRNESSELRAIQSCTKKTRSRSYSSRNRTRYSRNAMKSNSSRCNGDDVNGEKRSDTRSNPSRSRSRSTSPRDSIRSNCSRGSIDTRNSKERRSRSTSSRSRYSRNAMKSNSSRCNGDDVNGKRRSGSRSNPSRSRSRSISPRDSIRSNCSRGSIDTRNSKERRSRSTSSRSRYSRNAMKSNSSRCNGDAVNGKRTSGSRSNPSRSRSRSTSPRDSIRSNCFRGSIETRNSKEKRSRSTSTRSRYSRNAMKSNSSRCNGDDANGKRRSGSRSNPSRSRSRSSSRPDSITSNCYRRGTDTSNGKERRSRSNSGSSSNRCSRGSTKLDPSRIADVNAKERGDSRSNRSHSRSKNSRDSTQSNCSHRSTSTSASNRKRRRSRSTRSRSRSRYSGTTSRSIREPRNTLIQLKKKKDNQESVQRYKNISLQLDASRKHTDSRMPSTSNSSSRQNEIPSNLLMKELRGLTKTKTIVRYQEQNDRRFTRIEVSINKTLVRLGDITRSNTPQDYQNVSQREDMRVVYSGEGFSRREDVRNDSREAYRREREDMRNISHGDVTQRSMLEDTIRISGCPDFPIAYLGELSNVNQMLMKNNFFSFLINREKEYCTPGKDVSKTVVMTTYLKRFVSVRVRSLLTLKDSKNAQDLTLMGDFNNVYKFLITVMREAYKSCNKALPEKEAHEALRIVWGRSKQLRNGELKKRK